MLHFGVLNNVLSIDNFQKTHQSTNCSLQPCLARCLHARLLQLLHWVDGHTSSSQVNQNNIAYIWKAYSVYLESLTDNIWLRYIMISFQRASRSVEEGEEETLDGCQRGCAHQRTGRNPPFWLFLSLFFFFVSPNFKLFKSRRCLRLVWVSRNSRPGFSFRIRNERSGWTRC